MMNIKHPSPLAAPHRERLTAAALCLLLLAGCGVKEPFGYVQVSGKVTYEDGSPIPADGIVLTFYPQGGALDSKTNPRPGMANLDRAGEFHAASSHLPNDGLVRGRHKVTVLAKDRTPLPARVVPPEYSDPFKTPLEVDTAHLPLELKIRKPQ